MTRAAAMAVAIAAIAVAIAVVLAPAACGRESAAHSGAQVSASEHRPGGPDADPGRLPEDPVAGHRSEIEWRAHMDAEERERQLGYDKRRLKEHRAVIKRLRAARARYDRALTAGAVVRASSRMPALIADVRDRIVAIDHWGVNSPLLKDYDALIAALTGAYPEARLASLRGDADALTRLRRDLDHRIRKMTDWLGQAARSEDE